MLLGKTTKLLLSLTLFFFFIIDDIIMKDVKKTDSYQIGWDKFFSFDSSLFHLHAFNLKLVSEKNKYPFYIFLKYLNKQCQEIKLQNTEQMQAVKYVKNYDTLIPKQQKV